MSEAEYSDQGMEDVHNRIFKPKDRVLKLKS